MSSNAETSYNDMSTLGYIRLQCAQAGWGLQEEEEEEGYAQRRAMHREQHASLCSGHSERAVDGGRWEDPLLHRSSYDKLIILLS